MENGEQPAYPTQGNSASGELEGGLTKREFIATMAMQGMITGAVELNLSREEAQLVAAQSIQYADELLKALSNKQP